MVTIKSLSIPDTNKIPASGGTFVIKGATGIDLSLTDPFQSGPKDSIWDISLSNVSINYEPYSVFLNPDFDPSYYSLSYKNEFFGRSFSFNIKLNLKTLEQGSSGEFISYIKIYGQDKSIELRQTFDNQSSSKVIELYLDDSLIHFKESEYSFLDVYFFYSEGVFQFFINGIDELFFQGAYDLPATYRLELGCKSNAANDGQFLFQPTRSSILPIIVGIPTIDSLKFLKVLNFKQGEFSVRANPGAPGTYNLILYLNSQTEAGNYVDLGDIEVISEIEGEDSVKFLSTNINRFYDDFNRLSVCPIRGAAQLTNKNKNSILYNRCICDGSSDLSKLTLDINLGGRTRLSDKGEASPEYKYIDSDGKVYGNNFSANRILLPRPEFEQNFPIKDLRSLELSDGRILYYGVKSEPLVNNERTISFKIDILPTHGEDYEIGDTYGFEHWSLVDLNTNEVIEERIFDTQVDSVNRTLVLKEGRYSLKVYDANVTLRLDSSSGPIIDMEQDIQKRFEYEYNFNSDQWPLEFDQDFQYLARDKYVELVFDVKRYNGSFLGYIYDPCDGRVDTISSPYDDVNLITNSYSVIENDVGELIFFYVNIDGENVYNSRDSSLSFRKIDLALGTLSNEKLGVGFNRDSERIISSRPNMSLITGPTSVPSWLSPFTINFSIRKYFIYSFDVCYNESSIKCYISWGTTSNKDTRPFHRIYNVRNNGPVIQGRTPFGEDFSFVYSDRSDRSGFIEYYYSQSPSVEPSLEIYSLNFMLGRDIESLKNIWQRGFSRAGLVKKYDLVSYENAYNYSRNFVRNSYEDLDQTSVIDIIDVEEVARANSLSLAIRILDRSYKMFMKSIGPSYVRAKFDKENSKILISMLDFSRKLPLTIVDEGPIYDLCSPLHFSSIDFIREFKGVIMDSYSACIGADGFVYSVATSNNVRNSFEIGISGGSIMNDYSNTYIYEHAYKVLNNPKYAVIGNSAYYIEDFSTVMIPMMNSWKRHNGLAGADIFRNNGYLMISSGGSSKCPSVFVLDTQDVYPIGGNSLQSFMPDLDTVNPSSLILSPNVLNNGFEYIIDNGNYAPAPIAVGLANSPTQRNQLDKGYRFKFRVEPFKDNFLDPISFIFALSKGTSAGVIFKVKYYSSKIELYRVQGSLQLDNSNDVLLDSIEELPSGIIDIYVFAKYFSDNTCKLSLLVKQGDYLTLFKRDNKDYYNFKNSFFKIVTADVPVSGFTGSLFFLRFENSMGEPNDDSLALREIDWGILETQQGFYSYTGVDSLFSQNFLPNSNKIIRKFDDSQIFSEGSVPDYSFKAVQTTLEDGFTYERHFPYGFVSKFRASSLSLGDKWFLFRDELLSKSLDPFNVHTIWSSDDDESGGRIWADAIDSDLDSFSADTFIVEGVNVKSVKIIGRNIPSDPWSTFSEISLLRNIIDIERIQRTDKGYLIHSKSYTLDIAYDEVCYLYQNGSNPALISKFYEGVFYIYTDKDLPYTEGLAEIYSSKSSKIITEPVRYRQIGFQIDALPTAEGYFKVSSLAFGKYNEIPLLYNNDIGSGVTYNLNVENFYTFDNQSFFKYDKIMSKQYNLTYSLFDSLSYAKFRSIMDETSISRKPVWIIDRHLVNPREFSLTLSSGQANASVIKDNSSEVIYSVSMNFRSVK
jgi:hypothetical protein